MATKREWESCEPSAEYAPDAFVQEKFIHASHLHQLAGVYNRYYRGRKDLLLLHIDERKLACQLIAEPSTNGEMFPHIYGKINKSAIVKVDLNWQPKDLA